jgi:hypothetical protein
MLCESSQAAGKESCLTRQGVKVWPDREALVDCDAQEVKAVYWLDLRAVDVDGERGGGGLPLPPTITCVLALAASKFPYVAVPSVLSTEVGRGWRGLPTAAFAISHNTAGEFPDSVSSARFDASLSRLTNPVTLFLAAL